LGIERMGGGIDYSELGIQRIRNGIDYSELGTGTNWGWDRLERIGERNEWGVGWTGPVFWKLVQSFWGGGRWTLDGLRLAAEGQSIWRRFVRGGAGPPGPKGAGLRYEALRAGVEPRKGLCT